MTKAAVAGPARDAPQTLFIGIGAQKSGTTWLADYLSRHPGVHMTARKELHYWNAVYPPHRRFTKTLQRRDAWRLAATGPLLWALERCGVEAAGDERRRRRAYAGMLRPTEPLHAAYVEAILAGHRGEPVAGEITPAYAMQSAEVFAEMARIAPDVRFIYIMRDPAARLVSGLRHNLRLRLGRAAVTAERVEAEIAVVLAAPDHPQIGRSRYDRTIGRLERSVSPGKVHYAFYEELFSQTEIGRLCAFLGVDPVHADTDRRVHTGRDRAGAISAQTEARLRAEFAGVYDFIETRFGRLPERWTPPAAARPAPTEEHAT